MSINDAIFVSLPILGILKVSREMLLSISVAKARRMPTREILYPGGQVILLLAVTALILLFRENLAMLFVGATLTGICIRMALEEIKRNQCFRNQH